MANAWMPVCFPAKAILRKLLHDLMDGGMELVVLGRRVCGLADIL
jgi:hypothetical protein